MIESNVQDMTCGHCAGRMSKVTNASAKVDVKIEGRTVSIDSKTSAD